MKKALVIISLVLSALLAAAAFYVQTDQFAAMIRPYVVAPLQEVLGNDAQIGWVRANFIPMYVEVHDISLPDAQGRPAVAIHKIKVYINPLPLLFKTVRIPSIMVLEPRILAERNRDGTINLAEIADRISANVSRLQRMPSSGYTVVLKTITLSLGSALIQDEVTGAHGSLTNVNVMTRVSRETKDFSLRIKDTRISVSAPAYPDINGELNASVRYEHGGYHLDEIKLAMVDTTLSLSGTVGSSSDPALNLHFKARTGPQTIGKLTGLLKNLKKEHRSYMETNATVGGTLSAPEVRGSVQLAGIAYEGLILKTASLTFGYRNKLLALSGGKWSLTRGGKSMTVDSLDAAIGYEDGGLNISRFDMRAGDLSVAVSGRADPKNGFDASVAVDSRNTGSTLAFLFGAPVVGPLALKGNLSGKVNDPLLDGTFSGGPLMVRNILFDSASGRFEYRAKKLSIVTSDVHQGAARYAFSGSVDWSGASALFDAKLKVARSDVGSIVALFYQPLPLHFSASGDLSFSGTSRNFIGNARLLVEPGYAYGESFTKGLVTATLRPGRISFPQVAVDKGSGHVQGTGWIGFDGTYEASIESRNVRLHEVDLLHGLPVDGAFDLSVESSGSFSQPRVEASLEMEDLLLNQSGMGAMDADLQIHNHVLACSARLGGTHAVFSGRMVLAAPYAWSMQTSVKVEDVDPLVVLNKQEQTSRVRMTVAGTVSARGNGGDISSINGSASFDHLGFAVGDYRIENREAAVLALKGDRISIVTMNMSGQATKLAVSGSARLMKDLDISFLGTANLSLMRPLFRELEYTNGTAEVKLNVKDSWQNPDITGELLVSNGEIKVRDIPQKFSQLNGKLTFDRKRMVIDTLSGSVGGGTLEASGKAQLSGLSLENLSTRVSFEDVTVHYPEGLASTLSGVLTFDSDGSDQYLSGDVAVKRAHYDKRVEWKSMLVDIGKGLYQKKKTETGWIGDTQLNIRFLGKENILLQNNLAKVPLEIDMFLRGTVNHPQLLGRVEAHAGSVYFRQNEFKIIHASADFVDPNRMNPVIDVQAEIQVREYLVRLAVSGSADRAVVTLLSNPQLPDSDILTLLALGKTGTELKGKEAGVGMSEAASFATGQFQDIFESRARSLTGLDRFQIDPYISKNDTSVPRVTVGKELVQNKVVVTYSSNVGVASPEQVFRIEYILDRHFSLVGERNDIGNTGADIKYRFEFK